MSDDKNKCLECDKVLDDDDVDFNKIHLGDGSIRFCYGCLMDEVKRECDSMVESGSIWEFEDGDGNPYTQLIKSSFESLIQMVEYNVEHKKKIVDEEMIKYKKMVF